MSTRAVFSFSDNFGSGTFHVNKHCDGYPTGAQEAFEAVLSQGKSWGLDRYESDEFAAGFIAANKTTGGGVRIQSSRRAAGDVEYGYKVFQAKGKAEPMLIVTAIDGWNDWKESKLWEGRLRDFSHEVAAKLEE